MTKEQILVGGDPGSFQTDERDNNLVGQTGDRLTILERILGLRASRFAEQGTLATLVDEIVAQMKRVTCSEM